jgi:hypothetical protein
MALSSSRRRLRRSRALGRRSGAEMVVGEKLSTDTFSLAQCVVETRQHVAPVREQASLDVRDVGEAAAGGHGQITLGEPGCEPPSQKIRARLCYLSVLVVVMAHD